MKEEDSKLDRLKTYVQEILDKWNESDAKIFLESEGWNH